DFGLAKSFELAGLSGITAAGMVAGTPFFMPRVQITHFRLLLPASDVWSMGESVYYMLTLRYARDFLPGVDPLHVTLSGRPPPLPSLVPPSPRPRRRPPRWRRIGTSATWCSASTR